MHEEGINVINIHIVLLLISGSIDLLISKKLGRRTQPPQICFPYSLHVKYLLFYPPNKHYRQVDTVQEEPRHGMVLVSALLNISTMLPVRQ